MLLPPFNQDVAAVLDFSLCWLDGERLHVDITDVNPPLIFILNLGPAMLARRLGIAPIQAFQIALLALSCAGATSTLPVMDLWPLDAVYRECPQLGAGRRAAPARMARPEALLYRHVVESFAARPPDAVAVDTHPPIVACDGPFDMIGCFSRDPGLARNFSEYRLAERVGRFAIRVRREE